MFETVSEKCDQNDTGKTTNFNLKQSFSNDSVGSTATKKCLDVDIETCTSLPLDSIGNDAKDKRLITPPPSVDNVKSMEEKNAKNSNHIGENNNLITFQAFDPSKVSPYFESNSSFLSPKKLSQGLFSSDKRSGRKSQWIKETIKSAGQKVSKKFHSRRHDYSFDEQKTFKNDGIENENEIDECSNSFTFKNLNNEKNTDNDEYLKECYNEQFNIFENDYYFDYSIPNYSTFEVPVNGGTGAQNDESTKNDKSSLNNPSLVVFKTKIESQHEEREEGSKAQIGGKIEGKIKDNLEEIRDEKNDKNEEKINHETMRKTTVNQLSFAIDDNGSDNDNYEQESSEYESNLERDTSITSSQYENKRQNKALIKELDNLILESKMQESSSKNVDQISISEISEEMPLNLEDSNEFSFYPGDEEQSNLDYYKKRAELRRKDQNVRQKSLSNQFIDNFMKDNNTINDYCKVFLLFLNKHPNFLQDYKNVLYFQPKKYDLDGPCFFKDLQKMFLTEFEVDEVKKAIDDNEKFKGIDEYDLNNSEIKIPNNSNEKKLLSRNHESEEEFNSCKRVKFLSEKDYEIQEFVSTDIPAITKKSKNLQQHSNDTDLNKLKKILNISKVNSYNNLKSIDEFNQSDLNLKSIINKGNQNNNELIGFPDLMTKNLINGLLELLGAPEELKDSNDLKLSLLCLHPCFAKAIGFLWNVSKISMTELEFVKKNYRKLREKLALYDVEIETINEQFNSVQRIHEGKIKELEKQIRKMREEQAYLRAYNNAKVTKLDMDISVCNGILGDFFRRDKDAEWKKNTEEKLHEVIRYFENQTKFVMETKEALVDTLNDLESFKDLEEENKHLIERQEMIERKYLEYQSAEEVFNRLSYSLEKKNKKIYKLNDRISFLEAQLKAKDEKIDFINKSNDEKLDQMVKMSIDNRKRSLGLWDRTKYETEITKKEDLLNQLRYKLDNKEDKLLIKENDLKNMEGKLKDKENIIDKLKLENEMLKYQIKDNKNYYDNKYEKMRKTLSSEIFELRGKLESRTKWFTREILIHKKNCQSSVEEALKVALKSEIAINAINSSKRLTASKAINYIMNKKKNLKKCLENLQVENIPMNEKYFTWESLPKCNSYRVNKKTQPTNDLVSIKNPNHFVTNSGPQQNDIIDYNQNSIIDVDSKNFEKKNIKSSENDCEQNEELLNKSFPSNKVNDEKKKDLENDEINNKNFKLSTNKDKCLEENEKDNHIQNVNFKFSDQLKFTENDNKLKFNDDSNILNGGNNLTNPKTNLSQDKISQFEDDYYISNDNEKILNNSNSLKGVQTELKKKSCFTASIPFSEKVVDNEEKVIDLQEGRSGSPSCFIPSTSINSIFNEPIECYGKGPGARFVRDKLRSSNFSRSKFTNSNISLNTTKSSRTTFEQFGENINDIINTMTSNFKRKLSNDNENKTDNENVLNEEQKLNFNGNHCTPVGKEQSLTPITAPMEQNNMTTPLTSNTTASLATKSSWFDFSNKNLSWHSFKFTTAGNNSQR